MNETVMVSKWHKELEVYSRIKNAIILEGNIYDSFEYPDGELKGAWLDIRHYLENFFLSAGYRDVIFYNHIDGFTASEEEMLDRFAKMVGMNASDGAVSAKFEAGENDAPRIIRDALTQREESIVIIMDMASRTIIAPDHLSAQDLKCYTVLKQALLGAADAPKADIAADVFMLCMRTSMARINSRLTAFMMLSASIAIITPQFPLLFSDFGITSKTRSSNF